jgi:hypothetical protein
VAAERYEAIPFHLATAPVLADSLSEVCPHELGALLAPVGRFLADHDTFQRAIAESAAPGCWRRLKFDPLPRIVPTEN